MTNTCWGKQLVLAAAATAFLLAANSFVTAQNKKYNPGDRVECDKAQIGRFRKGTVVPFDKLDLDKSGRWYRVKLDEDTIPNSTTECMAMHMRPLVEKDDPQNDPAGDEPNQSNKNNDTNGSPFGTTEKETANQNKQKETERTTPKTGGAPHSLPGTAWKIDFGKGVTGTLFLFCRNGRWHNVLPNSIGAVGSSYSVSGNTLTTVSQDDKKVEKWKMTWRGDVLELNDGKVTLSLHYNGETQCK